MIQSLTSSTSILMAGITLAFLLTSSTFSEEKKKKQGTYINISKEKKYAYGRTKGRYIRRNGKLIYIPGVPKFETRKTGTEISIGNISVVDHGITLNIDLKAVSRKDHLRTDKGIKISLMTSDYHTLNGKRFKVLGTHEGRAYFRESKGKTYISAPLANHKGDEKAPENTEETSEESEETDG